MSIVADLIRFLVDPINVLWILVLVSVIFYLQKNERLFKRIGGLSVFWFMVISTPLVPGLVLNSLENRYEPVEVEQLADHSAEYHIIIFGGGHGFDDRLPPNSLLSLNALGRLNEGIRLHNQLPNSKLVLSGYSASGRTTQAEMLKQTALLLGVSEDVIHIQKEPANTWQEVNIYVENFGNSHPVIIVTSAAHMPRAVRVFQHFNIEPLPSPTNYRLKGSWRKKRFGLPSIRNISNLKAGMNEYAAMTRDRWLRSQQ